MATNYGGSIQRPGAPRPGGYGGERQDSPKPAIAVADIKLEPLVVTLFADIAKDKAERVYVAGGGRRNKSTQLRRFYDELVMWFDKVHMARTKEARERKYAEVAPFIRMMNAKVAYALGREHVDECFEQMFSHLIRQINGPDSLKHAKLFMEAFMGFYKAQEK